MKKILVFICLLFTLVSPSQAEELTNPDIFLKTWLGSLMETLNSDSTLLRDDSKMEVYVSEKVLSQFDMELLSRSIVGEPIWAKASRKDQINLTTEMGLFFRHLISKTLSEYDNQTLAFDETTFSTDKERVAIKGRILDKKDETLAFNCRLIKNSDTWKIYDVTLGGVDLIYTYKSNFKPTLEDGGVARLAAELHKKNLAVASVK
jgi:phospholipid transport system substrate-binding protein